MSPNLFKLLAAVVAAIVMGFVSYPVGGMLASLFRWRSDAAAMAQREADAEREARIRRQVEQRELVIKTRRNTEAVEMVDDSVGDEWEKGFEEINDESEAPGIDDSVAVAEGDETFDKEDGFHESSSASYMLKDKEAVLPDVPEEKDMPAVAGQTDVVPAAMDRQGISEATSGVKKFAKLLEKDLGRAKRTPFVNEEFSPSEWKKPENIYKTLSDRVMQKLTDKPTNAKIFAFMESPQNRLDLATLTLCRKAGFGAIREVTEQRLGTSLLTQLTSDLDWMTDTLYSGPTDRLGQGLKYLAAINSRYSEDMGDPTVRRIATTTALEFAREGWPEKDMLERFNYYYTSHREGKLNKIFDNLRYWETRLVTGNREYSGWGSPQSLAWQRDNVRLPVEGYLGASGQLTYRLRNAAGDSVFSGDYIGPIRKATNNITALQYREIGGVCGACSHYGAYGALAAGIPAMTMGEPGHCAYTVRVGDQWRKGYSIYWQHGMHKTFWGLHDWEFLILAQDLYSDVYPTMASDQLTAMAEFLASKRMTRSAMSCYDAATVAQPLNWPAWTSYAGYLKQKGSDHKERWKELSDRVTNTMATKYHNVAATLQSRYIYPQLLPLMPDRKERNKQFAAFFKKCNDYGVHTWDITPLLDSQMAGCTTDADKVNYMKEVLSILMGKQDYAGAVLAWGLDVVSKLPDNNGKASPVQEEFTKIIMRSMTRMRSGKKDQGATWGSLGEAIDKAAKNGDSFTFQAIGKMAQAKCKDYFPKHKFKFRPFTGRVVSSKGLITTATTLDGNGVKQSCLHWGVLQKTGGSIPIKFEGKSGITVKLDSPSDLNGFVAVFDCKIKNDRRFYLESSEDGRNWSAVSGSATIEGSLMRIDLKKSQAAGRYVRLLREGDKWDSGHIVGLYVYGKPRKS